jgi:hypothetical protein
MLKQHSIARPVIAVSAAMLLALAAGCSKPADQNNASAASAATTQTATPTQGTAASKLIRNNDFRQSAVILEGADVGPGPVRYLLTGNSQCIDAGTGANDGYKQFN